MPATILVGAQWIEEISAIPITMISVGPEREQAISVGTGG